ncbi:MAG: hypothetical protein JNL25_18085 [Rhodospirillaceae bacterium]|nr:hypothetical protein [Rhodospirillaceae bacterium]
MSKHRPNQRPPLAFWRCVLALVPAAIVGMGAWILGHFPLQLAGIDIDRVVFTHGSFEGVSALEALGTLFVTALFAMIFPYWIYALPIAIILAIATECYALSGRLTVRSAFIFGAVVSGGIGLCIELLQGQIGSLSFIPNMFGGAAMSTVYVLCTKNVRAAAS